jgi:DNA-3-methyladenine glycosylase II
LHRTELVVDAVAPFDFDLSASIFSGGDRRIAKYENGRFWQVLRVDDKLVLVAVRSVGTVDQPRLRVDLKSNENILERDKEIVQDLVCVSFNLRFDLNAFYEEVREDRVMAVLTQRLRGLKSPTTVTVFEALVDSIVEQQISLSVAEKLEGRLVEALGDVLKLGSDVYFAFPTPQSLASASVEVLRKCGLSSRKVKYIRRVSGLVANGKLDLEKFREYDDAEEVIRELDRVRGVGVWTAQMTMVRGMQRLDVMPADDLGLRRVISHYYCDDKRISGEEARGIGEKWGKWKGLASYYLVVAEILEQ